MDLVIVLRDHLVWIPYLSGVDCMEDVYGCPSYHSFFFFLWFVLSVLLLLNQYIPNCILDMTFWYLNTKSCLSLEIYDWLTSYSLILVYGLPGLKEVNFTWDRNFMLTQILSTPIFQSLLFSRSQPKIHTHIRTYKETNFTNRVKRVFV